jgi:DNA topoisomerase-1
MIQSPARPITRNLPAGKNAAQATFFIHNSQITDKEEVQRLRKLGIPPAWKDVTIAQRPTAKIQATGIDAAGRTQYIYSTSFRTRQEKAKFEKILRFAEALPDMRKIIEKDLSLRELEKAKVLATIVHIMDHTYMRVGNEMYAREHQHYGVTTLRSRHTTVKGDVVIFDFVGKSGQEHHQTITDRRLTRIVKKLDDLPSYELFQYQDSGGNLHLINSQDVNEYIKAVMGNEFSAKDFRTWAGTMLATSELALSARADTTGARKKAITTAVKKVAKRLGNTLAIARASYIDPRIFNFYMKNDKLAEVWTTMQHMKPRKYMQPEEVCVMELLTTVK